MLFGELADHFGSDAGAIAAYLDRLGSKWSGLRYACLANVLEYGDASCVPALIAADAVATVVGPNGRREIPVAEVATGPGKTSLAKGEILASFFLPARPAKSGDAYLRFIPRTEMDIAVVGAGVNITLDGSGTCSAARVALGGDVGNAPFWVATYLTVGALYFAVAFGLSRVALRLERRYPARDLVRSLAVADPSSASPPPSSAAPSFISG